MTFESETNDRNEENRVRTSTAGVGTGVSAVPGMSASTAACFAVPRMPFTTPTVLRPVALVVSGSVSVLGADAGARVGSDSGRAGARKTLLRLPMGSSSVGWSSVVDHLPSTMYL